MPLCVGWHLVIRVFPIGITWERRMKLPGPDLPRGGIIPCLVLCRGTYPCSLSPTHGDPDSTQILTRYYGAKSQTISHLTNTGTTPTWQVPVVQPLWVIKTPTDGICTCTAHPSDNPDVHGGFISH